MKFTNKFAIVLLATNKEYNNGLVKKCLDSYLADNFSKHHSIDILIYFNKGETNQYSDLFAYSKCKNVNSIKIYSHQLSLEQDAYFRTPESMRRIPRNKIHNLGGSGGPNLLFYKSIIPLMDDHYDYYLMIEPDTRPLEKYWLDLILKKLNKEFLIVGSRYKGNQQLAPYQTWSGHLNGVAIYKKSKHTKYLLEESQKLIEYHVRNGINKFISFDVGIWLFTQTLEWIQYLSKNNIKFSPLFDCDFISNYSLLIDINLEKKDILSRHPNTIILHQKWN